MRRTLQKRVARTAAAVLLVVAAVLSSAAPAAAQDMRRPKKLIATGWDHPDSRRFRENLREMEKRPFDGVVLEIVGTDDAGKQVALRGGFSAAAWEERWFDAAVADRSVCRSQKLTDNFVSFGANPGNVDWFDDAGWKKVVEHWRIAARVAKRSGLKGILFDPEPYTDPHAQFRYAAQAERERHNFNEYHAQARLRGRQVMEAVAGEYADIVLFTYFMNSVNAAATGRADPRPALEGSGYGLYPAFIDGWLDSVPPTVTLVDGCESAYRYNAPEQFLASTVDMHGRCQELVSPENRAKYRAQVQASFGIYLDAYWNPPESPWHIDGRGGDRVARLRINATTALRAADEYVWIYGEKFRWWPTPNGRVSAETWPEALPGSEVALGLARNPVEYARGLISERRKAGRLQNLVANGEFVLEEATDAEGRTVRCFAGGPPAGWGAWQEETSHGTFSWDRETGSAAPGAARSNGVADGCFIQSHAAEPGETYAVRAVRKLAGRGEASIRVRWQTDEGRWTHETEDVLIYAEGPREEWAELFGVAEVPPDAGRLVILLGMRGQQAAEDAVWFDDVELYRVEGTATR